MTVLVELLAVILIGGIVGFWSQVLYRAYRRHRGGQVQITGDHSIAIQAGRNISITASHGSIAAHTIVGDVNVGGGRWVGIDPNPLRRALLAKSGPGQPLYMFGEVDSHDELPSMVNAAADHIGKWWWDRNRDVAYLWLGQGYKVISASRTDTAIHPDACQIAEFAAQCACPRCGFVNTHYIQPCKEDPDVVTRECTECAQTWRQR